MIYFNWLILYYIDLVEPSQPVLYCHQEDKLLEIGEDVDVIEATADTELACHCTVPSSRPAATITVVMGK